MLLQLHLKIQESTGDITLIPLSSLRKCWCHDRSVSAFAPICNPIKCPWGVKAFTGTSPESLFEIRVFLVLCFLNQFTKFGRLCSTFHPSLCEFAMLVVNSGYLGGDTSSWSNYDASELVRQSGQNSFDDILIDVGLADSFLTNGQLLPEVRRWQRWRLLRIVIVSLVLLSLVHHP